MKLYRIFWTMDGCPGKEFGGIQIMRLHAAKLACYLANNQFPNCHFYYRRLKIAGDNPIERFSVIRAICGDRELAGVNRSAAEIKRIASLKLAGNIKTVPYPFSEVWYIVGDRGISTCEN